MRITNNVEEQDMRDLRMWLVLPMLLALSTCPTAGAAEETTSNERAELIEAAADKLKAEYVYPDVAEQMARSIRARARRGEYASLSGQVLADKLKADLVDASHDKHIWVGYRPEGAADEPRTPSIEDMKKWRAGAASDNFGFRKVERMAGNIGYVEFALFAYPYLAADTATLAMSFVAHTDALIIDLRNNGGGDPAMVAYMLSYLFDERTRLNDLHYRRDNRIEQFWTMAHVPGSVYGGTKPVFVLTSHATFSGAEDFSYALQTHKRARIVGEKTGGGAHPSREFRVTEHFTLAVPFARSVSPITGGNWEGTGVVPDIPVSAGDALHVAYRASLEAVRDAATNEGHRQSIRQLLDGLPRD